MENLIEGDCMNNDSVFVRNATQGNFTIIQNNILKNQDLNLRARGLLCTLLSLPDKWEFSIYGLTKIFPDKESAIKKALSDIEAAGYLKRERKRGERGRYCGWVWSIFDTPQPKEEEAKQEDSTDKQKNRLSVNPTVGKTDSRKNEQSDNNNSIYNNNTNKESNTKYNQELKESKKETARRKVNAKAELCDCVDRYTNDDELRELLYEWLENRKSRGATQTVSSVERNLKKLVEFADSSGLSVNDYLEEVVRRGWQAFFKIDSMQTAKNRLEASKDGASIGRNDGNPASDSKPDTGWDFSAVRCV